MTRVGKTDADRHFAQAVAWEKKNDLAEAVREYQTAIDLNPSLFEAYAAMGQIYVELRQFQDAVNVLKRGIELNPRNAKMHAQLSRAYECQGMDTLAMQSIQRAVELDPSSAPYHLWLGRLWTRQDKHKLAIFEYQRSMDLDSSNPEVHFALAEECGAVHRSDLAVQILREAINLHPYNAEAHLKLGITLLRLGQIDEAVRSFSDTLEIDPSNSSAHYHLAKAQHNQDKLEDAPSHVSRPARDLDVSLESLARQGRKNAAQAIEESGKILLGAAWPPAVKAESLKPVPSSTESVPFAPSTMDAPWTSFPRSQVPEAMPQVPEAMPGDNALGRVSMPPPPFAPAAPRAPSSKALVFESIEEAPPTFLESSSGPTGLSSYGRAMVALGEGHLDKARELLQEILDVDEKDHRALFFLAVCLRLLGNKFLASQFLAIGFNAAQAVDDTAFLAMYRAEMGGT